MKCALITGITGQSGSYLAELLLNKGYTVHGLVRRTSQPSTGHIAHILDRLHIHDGDLSDASLAQVIRDVRPDECYNLAAQSHVASSFKMPRYTFDVTAGAVARLLEAIHCFAPECRFYQASSSELFGSSPPPQNEETPFRPRSPYAVAKLAAYWMVRQYRDAYSLYACNGILYNHESPRRGVTFVTRKITRATARIKLGLQDKLFLGNLDAKRDWGFAGDYVEAMWRMLQQEKPDDFVIATGETRTVREFVEASFARVELDWQKHVEIDHAFLRPTDVDALCGDASKARRVLGWAPRVRFTELVAMMLDADLTIARRETIAINVTEPRERTLVTTMVAGGEKKD